MTLKCPITCSHCFLEAGPSRTEEVSLRNAIDWIKQAASYNNGFIEGLSITGGDPFYNMEKLQTIVNVAGNFDIKTTAITSAFWAATRDKALKTLESVPLTMIAISTDKYHQNYVPFSNIKNAVYAAEKLNIDYEIVVSTENVNSPECKSIIKDITKLTSYNKIEITTVFPVGRASQLNMNKKYTKKPPKIPCLFATTPFIFPNGIVTACIGPLVTLHYNNPLILGDLRNNTLEYILRSSEDNLLLHSLRLWGPRILYNILQQKGLSQLLPKKFVKNNICDSCYNLLKNKSIEKEIANLEELREKIAYERTYYMGEVSMLEEILGKKVKINNYKY
ncbi:MAG: radical SAM protein [Promethearchaeota archaeon]